MVVPHRAKDAKRNANEDGNHHRCRAELQRDRKRLADDVRNRPRALGVGGPEIALESPAEKNSVLLQGDLGPSYTQRSRTVSDIIGETFPVSLQLGAAAMVIAVFIGIPLGILGAVRHNHPLDYLSTFVSVLGISTPPYVVTSLLVLVLASKLHFVPTGGWDGIWSTKSIVPAISLALYPTAVLARYTRSSMLEVLRTDFMRTARAKGLREGAVMLRHGVRNALLPVITIAGIVLADVATGSFFVETIYQVPGIGRYFVHSIAGRDYPVILGTVLVLGLTVSLMNLLVDLLYPLLDPRIGSR